MGFIQRFRENRTLDTLLREERAELSSEVSNEVVGSRMNKAIRKKDFQCLSALHGYFPRVEPDYETVQKAYSRHYENNNLELAHKLFDIFGIEPEHTFSEDIIMVGREKFKVEVIDKEIKRRPIIKDKHIVTLRLIEDGRIYRRKVSAEEFNSLQPGKIYYHNIPILQDVNMLGHKTGDPYFVPTNLFFG